MIRSLAESRSASSPRIRKLRQQLRRQGQYPIDWLVIAHEEPQLLQRLADALAASSAVLLPLSQAAWNDEEETLQAVVEWAIREADVHAIVLVGHSQSSACPKHLVMKSDWNGEASGPRDAKQAGWNRLTSRIAHGQDHLRRAKQHLADQVIRLADNRQRWQQDSENVPAICGLFYMAENDSFLALEPDTREFRCLDEAIFKRQP